MKTLLCFVWMMTLVCCVCLCIFAPNLAQVLAGLAQGKNSSHSYHPSMTYCVVSVVLSCATFASRCEICVLLLRAYIICFCRSCVTVSSLIFFFPVFLMTSLQSEYYQLWNIGLPICRIQCCCSTTLQSYFFRANQVYELGT